RGELLSDALSAELDRTSEEVRAHVNHSFEAREAEKAKERENPNLATKDFTALKDAEVDEVRRALRVFVERLRGGQHVRERRARLGARIDPHKTLRRALRTHGVPFVLVKKSKKPEKPRLVLLCDVSDSVRLAARFMLELTYVAQELWSKTRS